jgi:hypothetical protein
MVSLSNHEHGWGTRKAAPHCERNGVASRSLMVRIPAGRGSRLRERN